MNNREISENIFMAGVRSVLPEKLITGIMRLEGSILAISDHKILLDSIKNIYVIGAGKACLLYTSPSPRDGLLSRMPSSA